MNAPLILGLISLRYKLLWAKTRSRNGRIALFLTGYLLLLLLLVLLGLEVWAPPSPASVQAKPCWWRRPC